VTEIEVRLPAAERAYPIRIEAGLLDRLGESIAPLAPSRIALITDRTVAALYLPRARASLGGDPLEIVVPAGEESKSAAQLHEVLDILLGANLDRDALVVALGGGVVGDLAGFAAAVALRGLRLAIVPTTLLAQVDSSVGGKTAINHPHGKNLIGAFHQPSIVLIDPTTLRTLPPRERASGLAEVVKTGLIRRRSLVERLESEIDRLLEPDGFAGATDILVDCCRIKAEVVRHDERESGLRRILNFGHTFGHALEAATDYRHWRHGEAVALGMRAALDLSVERAGLPPDEAARGRALIERIPTPPLDRPLDPDRLRAAVARDKKAAGGRIRAVVLESLGKARDEPVEIDRIVEGALSIVG
jgi:3-dehydroquinate synthase